MKQRKLAASPRFYAHSRAGLPEASWEPLEDHLRDVAERARSFGDVFGSGDWAYLAGLWHDLGKYRPEFQRRLRGSGEQVEHAGAGAALAMSKGTVGLPLAFVIAGHHAGLANHQSQGETSQQPLTTRLRDNVPALETIQPAINEATRSHTLPSLPAFLSLDVATPPDAMRRRFEIWTRFLFSVLVDADRLATEAFYDPEASKRRGTSASIGQLRKMLDRHLARFSANTAVNRLRADVLADCRQASTLAPGLFSLTAPTGAGKTLSAMAFALRHAEAHQLRRVIVVVPYTSIIEQNAGVFRDALGYAGVAEHHSNVDAEAREQVDREQEIRRRFAAENWDAPVIVTTTVQLFESLFSNEPSRCRKLHNVTRSVIVLDEAQSLPAGYLTCILDVLRELVRAYGCSIVISTATQPALGRREALPTGLEDVREIIRDPRALSASLKRVRMEWPRDEEPPVTYADIAREAVCHERVLAIVHLRRDARELARQLPGDNLFHLSALMCAAHRAATLAAIRDALRAGGRCRVVSTQLVEAGVDLDFPVVFRALAGLDSIAQAAGRCNREGMLETGTVRVFRAETKPPPGVLRFGLESTEALLARHGDRLDCQDGEHLEEYFRILYSKCETDRKNVQSERESLNFATVGDLVRLIEDGYKHPVVVPWGDAADRVARFAAYPSRATQRALQPFIVQVHDIDLRTLRSLGALELVHDSVLVLQPLFRRLYDDKFGLVISESAQPEPAGLVV